MAALFASLSLNSSGYHILLLLHVTCVVVGFGSSFVYPIMGAEAGRRRGVEAKALSETSLLAAGRVTTPVIWAAGLLGFILVIAGPWDFDELWVQAAMTLFIVLVLFAQFVHMPNLRKMNALTAQLATFAGPPAGGAPPGPPPQAVEMEQRAKRAAMYGGILHLGFVALLILMIWKPQ